MPHLTVLLYHLLLLRVIFGISIHLSNFLVRLWYYGIVTVGLLHYFFPVYELLVGSTVQS